MEKWITIVIIVGALIGIIGLGTSAVFAQDAHPEIIDVNYPSSMRFGQQDVIQVTIDNFAINEGGTVDNIQLVTITLALYGALVSTILAVYRFYENRRKLKVELSHSVVASSPGQTRLVLSLSCSNLGKRSITLTSYGIALPNKKYIFFKNESPQHLPCTLLDGQGCTLFASLKGIAEMVIQEGYKNSVELIGFFGDTSSKRYLGKKLKFQPSSWLDEKYR